MLKICKIFIISLFLCSFVLADNPYRTLNNFNAGELSPKVYGRQDLDKFEGGCKTLLNFLPLPQGGVVRRPAFEYIAGAKTNNNGVKLISEGANMPSIPEAIEIYLNNKLFYGLGKAANAGGVAVSALEMAQNSMRLSWTREEVDNKLKSIMQSIHDQSYEAAKEYGHEGNYVVGANIAGFLKIANSMMDQGVV